MPSSRGDFEAERNHEEIEHSAKDFHEPFEPWAVLDDVSDPRCVVFLGGGAVRNGISSQSSLPV
jgi:hypothetical protein